MRSSSTHEDWYVHDGIPGGESVWVSSAEAAILFLESILALGPDPQGFTPVVERRVSTRFYSPSSIRARATS